MSVDSPSDDDVKSLVIQQQECDAESARNVEFRKTVRQSATDQAAKIIGRDSQELIDNPALARELLDDVDADRRL